MTVQTSGRRLICLGGLGFLVAVALLSLSFPQLFFEPLPFWYRMADQALLVTGLLGSVLTSKPLRIAGGQGFACTFCMRCSVHYRASTTQPLIRMGNSALSCGCPDPRSGWLYPCHW